MPEYIEREKLHKHFENNVTKNEVTVNGQKNLAYLCDHVLHEIRNAPTADVVEVRYGEWVLDVHSFYKDTYSEESELAVYIIARCSNCGEKHPNGNTGQVFSETVYAPEGQEYGYKFDQDYEKFKILEKFKQRNYEFKNYCPNCGAKMDGKGD